MRNRLVYTVVGCCWIFLVSAGMSAETPISAKTSIRPFAADQVSKVGAKTTMGKVYATENAMRLESQDNGKQFVNIVRADRKVVWSLFPARKMYIELPLQGMVGVSALPRVPGVENVLRTNLGSEQVAAHLCDKSRVQSTSSGKTLHFIEWAAGDLNGFVVKREDEEGKWSIEYRNVQLGPQDPSLFEIPAGYQKLNMNGMGH